jgi:hypothetical protein
MTRRVFLGLWAFTISLGVIALGLLVLWERSP